jgi:dTDP-4-amino-4,6-dideoxygalactose transaminase
VIPRFRPTLGAAELAAIFERNSPTDLSTFEMDFARTVGTKFAIAFPYGRTGLLLLLKALGLQNSTIICPAYTCVVVPHAIVLSGNKPIFVDSGVDANMDLDHAEAAIKPDTSALIATSIFGNPVDLDRLSEIQRRHPQLIVIQDCAHSFIAEWNGKPVHHAGRAALFALNASKMMTSIFGGMITTDEANLAARLVAERDRSIRSPGAPKAVARALYLMAIYAAFLPPVFSLTERLWRSGWLNRFTRYYDESLIDMPGDYLIGMTSVEARIGSIQSRRLESFLESRRTYAAFYREHLADMPALGWIEAPAGSSFSHVAARVANKQRVMRKALTRGVQLGEIIEYSVPEMDSYRAICVDQGAFPISNALSRETINLPVSGRFDRSLAERVVRAMREVLADEPAIVALVSC